MEAYWEEGDQFTDIWLSVMKGLALASPLDEKARDAALAYFAPGPRSISACADQLGVERKTALRRLMRAQDRGWITVYAEPEKAGSGTLNRVVLRRVFWTDGLPWDWEG